MAISLPNRYKTNMLYRKDTVFFYFVRKDLKGRPNMKNKNRCLGAPVHGELPCSGITTTDTRSVLGKHLNKLMKLTRNTTPARFQGCGFG